MDVLVQITTSNITNYKVSHDKSYYCLFIRNIGQTLMKSKIVFKIKIQE